MESPRESARTPIGKLGGASGVVSPCSPQTCMARMPACIRPRRSSGAPDGVEDGEMNFCATGYPKEAMGIMAVMKRNQMLCDVELIAGSEVFFAHKLVLAAGSPYFKAMFTSGLRESDMNQVTLQGVCPVVMGRLLYFMYTAEIRINEMNVCQLLPAATMFQMTHVIEACCNFLESQLDASNAIGIANFAQQHGCMELYKKANGFINQHFSQVCHEEEFLLLSSCQLVNLVQRDELNVRGETEVYNAVLKWVMHDELNRQPKIEHILSAVRCQNLSPNFLRDQITHCELVNRNPQCREYLIRIFQDLKLNKKLEMRQRVPTAPLVVYVAGGYLRHSLDNMECYVVQERTWVPLSPLPVPRSGLGGAFINRLFYAVGGRNNSADDNQDSDAVDCYDPLTNTWRSCAKLSVARNRVGVGVIDGLMYAVGGSQGKTHHSTVERYEPEEDKWYEVAAMNEKRIGVGVAIVDRTLYAVGGFDGTNRLFSVEKYEPDKNKWTTMAPMKTTRSGAGVVAMGHHVYAVGGYDGTCQLRSVERYDTEKDEWVTLASMRSPRSALSVAVLTGKLFALGGYDGRNFLASVEVYDPSVGEWAEAPSMTCGRSGHAAAVWSAPCLAHSS